MRLYAVYFLMIVGLLAVSGTQAEDLVQPPAEYTGTHFHHLMAAKFP